MMVEYRDLKKQYQVLKKDIDAAIGKVLSDSNFVSGFQVAELEEQLATYVGVKHCITCANGTDALQLAAMAWDWGEGDAIFVPDFTFFASGEIVAAVGATPIFVDVEENTFNISPNSLINAIEKVLKEGRLKPKAVVSVDLFGLAADYGRLRSIVDKYGLKILEDAAQGFGAEIGGKRAGSFGDISTTSFFPAKPLGCYGDGGAIFTDDDDIASIIKSLRIHGEGIDKYDNVRIGMNSRLDTLQAAILKVKLKAFADYERDDINKAAKRYDSLLADIVKIPKIPNGFISSRAQYTIVLKNKKVRDSLQKALKADGIPSMVYYPKPMHKQEAFAPYDCVKVDLSVSKKLTECVLSLPLHPYITEEDQKKVAEAIKNYIEENK